MNPDAWRDLLRQIDDARNHDDNHTQMPDGWTIQATATNRDKD